MAIHDDSGIVASKDRCHGLAWTLDAGIMNGHLTEKHLVKLEQYFQEVRESASEHPLRVAASKYVHSP